MILGELKTLALLLMRYFRILIPKESLVKKKYEP